MKKNPMIGGVLSNPVQLQKARITFVVRCLDNIIH